MAEGITTEDAVYSLPGGRPLGFIGLGAMGFPMATRLRKKTSRASKLYVFDIDASTSSRFVSSFSPDDAVMACKSSKEVGDNADIIFTTLPEGAHVEAVYSELQQCNLQNKVLLDCSTIDPATSRKVASLIRLTGGRFYDAPVSGGVMGARDGTLTFLVGASEPDSQDDFKQPEGTEKRKEQEKGEEEGDKDGESEDMKLVKPLLKQTMGKSVFLCGHQSSGLVAKLANNYCSGLIQIATAEAMNLGMRSGLSAPFLSHIFRSSTAGSWQNEHCNPVPGISPNAPASHGYEGGFRVPLMVKDFSLALGLGAEVGAKMVMGETGLKVFREVSADERCRDKDSRVVYRWLGGKE